MNALTEWRNSEKARIPAWTDRVLKKGSNLRQLSYDSAPLRFSDHRPVYATFECRVSIVDEAKRNAISQELYQRRKTDVGDTVANLEGEESDDEDLIGYDSVEPGLPPASSDRQKWWLDNGQPARAQVTVPPGNGGQPMALDPNRQSNPFGRSIEGDWVAVPRASAGTVPRKQLPPALDASKLPSKVGSLRTQDARSIKSQTTGESTRTAATAPPPVPPPRRGASSSARATPVPDLDGNDTAPPTPPRRGSTASQLSKSGKSPPAVAKKPAHLVTGTSPLTKTASGASTLSSQGTREVGPPPLPTRTASNASQRSLQATLAKKVASQAQARPGVNGDAQGPPALPGRAGQTAGGVDLLDSLDEGGEGMGGWETLQPAK